MSQSLFFQIAMYGALLSELLLLLIATWNYTNIDDIIRPFFFFFYYVLLQESFSFVTGWGFSIHTVWWANIYQVTEMIFFTWYFHRWLFGDGKRTWYFILLSSFMIYWIYSTFFSQNFSEANAFARTIGCLVVAAYAGANLIQLSKRTDITLFRNAQFWIGSGALLYFSFTTLVFGIYQTIANNNYLLGLYYPVWDVHLIMNILANLLYSIAFMCRSKTSWFLSRN